MLDAIQQAFEKAIAACAKAVEAFVETIIPALDRFGRYLLQHSEIRSVLNLLDNHLDENEQALSLGDLALICRTDGLAKVPRLRFDSEGSIRPSEN